MAAGEPPVGRSVFPLRPLGVGEVLDAAVTTMRAYPRVTLGPSALMYASALVVSLALAGVLAALIFSNDDPVAQMLAASLATLGFIGAQSVGSLLQLAAVAAFSTLMSGTVARAMLGRPAPLRAVWHDTKRSFGWLVLYALMLSAASVVPFLLLGVAAFAGAIPAVGPYLYLATVVLLAVVTAFFYAQVWLAPAAIVFERVHVARGIARSWQVTSTGRWRATGVFGLTMLICLLLWAAISSGLYSVASLLAYTFSIAFSPTTLTVILLIATFLGGLMIGTVCTPFLSVISAVAYADQRMRAEGLDLTLGEARTSGRLRDLPVEFTLIGPATPFAAPTDRRPPEPQPRRRPVRPPPMPPRPLPVPPPGVRAGG
ncbi:MAG: hypothetical protein GEV10_01150 [Streptosporangiales bacterium]|nr:hypothetical protein [Streptosporangiales bacterium]